MLHPPLPPLTKDRVQMALEEGAGVGEVLLGVGFGCGDAVEGFVQEGDDALLFGEGWNADSDFLDLSFVY